MFSNRQKKIEQLLKKINVGEFSSLQILLEKSNYSTLHEVKNLNSLLIKGKENISNVIKDVFKVATQVSAFDLKLAFYGEIMSSIADEINMMSESLIHHFRRQI